MYVILNLVHLSPSNSLEQISFLEANLPCMEPKTPLPCSQGHTIGPYSSSEETNPTPIILLL
jgi:hypothetical protein